jgi:amidohydrolase
MTLPNDPHRAVADATRAIEPRLIGIRRDIHAHPELAFQEVRTAGIVAAELARLGIPHRTGVGGTGVVGEIAGGRPGPTLLIRADMDALPMPELTGLPWASTTPNVMHACGHDLHTTTLIGVAEVLNGMRQQLSGTVRLMFQPAEEVLGGAPAMIEQGVLDGVDMALSLHNQPEVPAERFAFTRGAALAASDRFDIVVTGRGAHAAQPHNGIDPIVAAANLVGQLQTVVSREVNPLHPVVVTIGMFQAGSTHNIIPDMVTLKGTVRTRHAAAQDIAEAAIGRLCAGLEHTMRCTAVLDYVRGVPAMVNDDGMLDRTMASVRRQFGDDVAIEREPVMGGEDFAFVAQKVPSFMLLVGSGAPGRADKLHNSRYQPDERCIALGVRALSAAAADILS